MVSEAAQTKPPGFGQYFDYPEALFELSLAQHVGLLPVGVLACLSVLSTAGVISFLTVRMWQTRNSRQGQDHRNQFLVLIYNLLCADLIQALSFLFSFHWQHINMILAPSAACWAQAWLLHLGDIASGSFVLAIALHTYWRVFAHYTRLIPHRTLVLSVLGIWAFSVLLASFAPILRGNGAFARAGSWCWISTKYETDRLMLHYVWIFIIEFGTIVLYAAVFVKLYCHTRGMRTLNMDQAVRSKIGRTQKYMAVYPTIYAVCTLPLAVGRMFSMAHGGRPLPDTYMLVAGCLITSCGWLDALMYTFTRDLLHTRDGSGNRSNGYSNNNGQSSGANSRGDRSKDSRPGAYNYDDVTVLRSMGGGHDWDRDIDSDTTTPLTTIITGGKNKEKFRVTGLSNNTPRHNGPAVPAKAHRFFGMGRNSSNNRDAKPSRFSEPFEPKSLSASQKHRTPSRTPAYTAAMASRRTSDDSTATLTEHFDPTPVAASMSPHFSIGRHFDSGADSSSDSHDTIHPFYSVTRPGDGSVAVGNSLADSKLSQGELGQTDKGAVPRALPFGQIKKETDIQVTRTER